VGELNPVKINDDNTDDDLNRDADDSAYGSDRRFLLLGDHSPASKSLIAP
jgi:hypothetical protein